MYDGGAVALPGYGYRWLTPNADAADLMVVARQEGLARHHL